MAQQINLYSPIFLAPQRHFSALAMAQALGAVALALVALCAWAQWSSRSLRGELQGTLQAHRVEREQLQAALAERSNTGNGVALEQELARLRADIGRRHRVLDELSRGLAAPGRSHAAILRLVAETVPPPVWLTELKLVDGRLELAGLTLQPEALQPWLAQLSANPLTAGQQLAAVKVERGGATGSPAAAAAQLDAWSFAVVSARPAAPTVLAAQGGGR